MNDQPMHCQDCEERFLDDLENALSPAERAQYEAHLDACPSCAQQRAEFAATWRAFDHAPKPSPELAKRFAAALDAYRSGQDDSEVASFSAPKTEPFRNRSVAFWRYGLAIAASGAVAFFAGLQIERQNSDQRLAAIEEQLTDIKEVTALSLLAQSSATERMRGAALLAQFDAQDPKALAALYDHVSYDPNINVRYAALQTLDRYAARPDVREKLIQFLSRSDSPLIRAELIKLLVKHEEQAAQPILLRISEDENENETIRELAKWSVKSLQQLRSEAI